VIPWGYSWRTYVCGTRRTLEDSLAESEH
jgi:hypothetical protein